ncbi:hypothetical protein V5O48_014095 [Marasmius crinis-equi]|uniref:Cryptic loci regulator 2 N-terminal domain-containing protein n=1 Tax=Marasmius crinis-equi TaxID=585013 RepID=A0ABR3EYM5_9AGAR
MEISPKPHDDPAVESLPSSSDKVDANPVIDNGIFWVQFPRSDGSSERRPGNPGTYKEIEENSPAKLKEHLRKWCFGIGEALARAFQWHDPTLYALSSLPEGYALYLSNHRGKNDYQLWGHKHHRFRTATEFIEHSIWLFKDSTLNRDNCRCLACTKRPQREITKDLKLRGIFPDVLRKHIRIPCESDYGRTPSATPQTEKHKLSSTRAAGSISPPQLQSPLDSESWRTHHPQTQPQETFPEMAASLSPSLTQPDLGSRPLPSNHHYTRSSPTELSQGSMLHSTTQPCTPARADLEVWTRYNANGSTILGTQLSSEPTQPTAPTYARYIPQWERSFRVGELVHIVLKNPIQIIPESNQKIHLWPAMIVEFAPIKGPFVDAIGIEEEQYHLDFVVELLGFGSLNSVTVVKQDQVVLYSPDHDIELLGMDCSDSELFEAGELPMTYAQAVTRARRLASTWSVAMADNAEKVKLEDGGVGVRTQTIRWGSEQIQPGDFVKIALSRAEHDALVTAGINLALQPDLGLFASVYVLQYRLDEAGTSGELMTTVGLFGLEQVDTDAEEEGPPPQQSSLPDPPAGFRFISLHDEESEVTLSADCITGRYFPGYLAKMLLDEDLPEEEEEILAHLERLWELQGVKMNATVRREFSVV